MEKETRTRIVCTLGPSTWEEEAVQRLLSSGMNVARLNFSHADHNVQERVFRTVRGLSERAGLQTAIICDIQGPKIRTGKMEAPFTLRFGEEVRVTSEDVVGTSERFTIDHRGIEDELVADDEIFINDGIVKLRVLRREGRDLVCRVRAGGLISDRKGCNIPSSSISVKMPTEKDKKDLKLIARLDPEYVAASFVGSRRDVERIRGALRSLGNDDIKVLSKIERPSALRDIDGIIKASDALMVARGDLGVEIPPSDVPVAQKEICRKCNKAGKPVIVATQMLESMTEHSRPTRAEASDVFNAVLDGADAVMLSGETSVGKHPDEAVRTMRDIVKRAESYLPYRDPDYYDSEEKRIVETIGHACNTIVKEFKDRGYSGSIIAVTESGHTARMISKYRPDMEMFAFTPEARTARELSLVWGARSVLVPELKGGTMEEMAVETIRMAASRGCLDGSDHIIMASSSRLQGTKGMYIGVIDLEGMWQEDC